MLQKRPMRFLVALNTLDKFLGRHAQVEDVFCTIWKRPVFVTDKLYERIVLKRLKKLEKRYACAI